MPPQSPRTTPRHAGVITAQSLGTSLLRSPLTSSHSLHLVPRPSPLSPLPHRRMPPQSPLPSPCSSRNQSPITLCTLPSPRPTHLISSLASLFPALPQDAATVAARVRLTLGVNKNTGSVSLYMAHGGTNFEWCAGCPPAHVHSPSAEPSHPSTLLRPFSLTL
jgi:hypothetical protein